MSFRRRLAHALRSGRARKIPWRKHSQKKAVSRRGIPWRTALAKPTFRLTSSAGGAVRLADARWQRRTVVIFSLQAVWPRAELQKLEDDNHVN